jgi:hypothetical protein
MSPRKIEIPEVAGKVKLLREKREEGNKFVKRKRGRGSGRKRSACNAVSSLLLFSIA